MNNIDKPSCSVVSGETVANIVDGKVSELIDVVAATYAAHEDGKSINPDSYFLKFPKNPRNRIIALPSSIELDREKELTGIKWIASYPKNIESDLPRASAVLILNDPITGYAYAILESSIISASRTAASAVTGAYYLNSQSKKVSSLGVIGAGPIANTILDFFAGSDWEVGEVMLHDLNRSRSEALGERIKAQFPKVTIVDELQELVETSEMLVCATVAPEPYILEPSWFAHSPIVLNISLRDISPEIILESTNVVDDIEHVLKQNTSVHLAEQRVNHRNFIDTTIGALINKGDKFQRSGTVIFSPFGLGVLDLAVGDFIYTQARASGLDHVIEGFYPL